MRILVLHILYFTFIVRPPSSRLVYLCSDINERAASATLLTGSQNKASDFSFALLLSTEDFSKVTLEPVVTSLTDAFNHRIRAMGGVDVLLFNPPYVPTESDEVADAQDVASIQGSWAGGLSGMEITNRVLDNLEVWTV